MRDTYRGVCLRSRHHPELSICGCVGKYIARPWKQIRVTQTGGTATLDRDGGMLSLNLEDGPMLTVHSTPDTGYDGFAECLKPATPLPAFLTVQEAHEIVRLVAQAQLIAVQLDHYPDGSVPIFGAKPTVERRLAALILDRVENSQFQSPWCARLASSLKRARR